MSSLFNILVCLIVLNTQGTNAKGYFGKRIGRLSPLEHGVKGDVYAVDSRTIHIKGFSYDGAAPDAFFYAGKTGNEPHDQGIVIPDENGSKEPLGAYNNKDVTITLPDGLTIRDISWISVWCKAYTINFGHLMIPPHFDYPRPQKIDPLPTYDHAVSSDRIVVVDAQTFLIPNFHYDGTAPDAFFWVGKGNKADTKGIKVPDENGSLEPLKRYAGKTIVITLPGDMTVFDIDYLSIWCRAFYVDFGHVLLPKNLNVPPSLKMLGVAPQTLSGYSYPSPTSSNFGARGTQPFNRPSPFSQQNSHFPSDHPQPSHRFERPLSTFEQNPFQHRPNQISHASKSSAFGSGAHAVVNPFDSPSRNQNNRAFNTNNNVPVVFRDDFSPFTNPNSQVRPFGSQLNQIPLLPVHEQPSQFYQPSFPQTPSQSIPSQPFRQSVPPNQTYRPNNSQLTVGSRRLPRPQFLSRPQAAFPPQSFDPYSVNSNDNFRSIDNRPSNFQRRQNTFNYETQPVNSHFRINSHNRSPSVRFGDGGFNRNLHRTGRDFQSGRLEHNSYQQGRRNTFEPLYDPNVQFYDNGKGSTFTVQRLQRQIMPERDEKRSSFLSSPTLNNSPQSITQSEHPSEFQSTYGRGLPNNPARFPNHDSPSVLSDNTQVYP